MMRKTILFRAWYYTGIKDLPDDKRLEAYDAVMAHAFTGESLTCSPEIAPVLNMIIESVDSDNSKFEAKKAAKGWV